MAQEFEPKENRHAVDALLPPSMAQKAEDVGVSKSAMPLDRLFVLAVLGILTLVVGVTSNLAQYFVSGPLFGGMSGVIYGYFGYVWIQSLSNPKFKVQLNPVIVKLLFGWFLICWTGLLEKLFGLNVAIGALQQHVMKKSGIDIIIQHNNKLGIHKLA